MATKRKAVPPKVLAGWGNRIYEARSAMRRKRGRGMTQAELGRAAGVSQQAIGFYELEINEPSYETWIRMAKALLMTPCDLVFGNTHVPIEEGVERPIEAARRPRKSEALGGDLRGRGGSAN